MNSVAESRFARFHPSHGVYVFALLVCGLATFGEEGIIVVTPICVFWGLVFTSRSRPRAFANICLLMLLAIVLLGLVSSAFAYTPRWAARRMTCSNNLKQIALALHNYHDQYRSFPPAYIADSNGRPIHSWRVLVLPFLEEGEGGGLVWLFTQGGVSRLTPLHSALGWHV